MEEQSDDHEEDDDDYRYLDTLLQEAIDEVNTRSFVSHAVRDQQVPHEEIAAFSSAEENENDSSSLEFVDAGVSPTIPAWNGIQLRGNW